MTIETTVIVTGVLILVIFGIIAAIAKHLINSDRHPNKKDIVFKNVCEAEMKGLKDCVEIEIKGVNARLDDLKCNVQKGFENLTDLIKNDRH